MSAVPEDDLPASLVPQSDLPDNVKEETYDPRDRVGALLPAAGGAVVGAVVPPMLRSGMNAMEAGRAPQGVMSRGPIVGEAASHTPFNPRGLTVEKSLQNWKMYNEAQLEASKKVRQESALHKKYPGFTRAGTDPIRAPLAPNATMAERALAKVVPGGASDLANFAKGVYDYKLPFIGGVGSLLGRGLVGAGAGIQGADVHNRIVEGDIPGAWISGIGAAGTAANLLPFLPAKVLGTGVGLTAEAVNAYRDAMRKGKIEHGAPENYGNTDAMGNMYAQGGLVHLANGGESNTGPFIGYPSINKNRKVGSGTGFLDAIVGAPPSRTNILNPSDYSYMEGYEKGEPYGIAAMALPFAGMAAKPVAKEIGTRAFMGESLTPKMMRGFMPEAPALGVVKQKGGNWAPSELSTGFDIGDQLSHVKTFPTKMTKEYMETSGYNPTQIQQHLGEVAVDDWIDKQLNRYVKNDMGTPEDPIRALAEKGILHYNPPVIHDYSDIMSEAAMNRGRSVKTGTVPPLSGVSDLAKNWETRTDAAIRPQVIKPELAESYADEFPWLGKSVGQNMYHSVDEFLPENLGFDHIADVLRDQIRTGQLRPESLKSLSVPQAVERAHEYNLARQRAMEKVKLQAQTELPVHKEYPEGYKWFDLKHPTKNDLTEQALEYEGNAMGHCVGGYCPEVISGKTKIYSLRDAKGEPHVTIEVRNTPHSRQSLLALPKEAQDRIAQEVYGTKGLTMDKVLANLPASGQRHSMGVIHDLAKKADELFPNPEQTIEQIKGKQNAAPKAEYQPFVQDFVRSGKWSKVNEAQNAGLKNMEMTGTNYELTNVPEDIAKISHTERYWAVQEAIANKDIPMYATEEEVADAIRKYARKPE